MAVWANGSGLNIATFVQIHRTSFSLGPVAASQLHHARKPNLDRTLPLPESCLFTRKNAARNPERFTNENTNSGRPLDAGWFDENLRV